eukprot:136503-Amphidinium_carterae.1
MSITQRAEEKKKKTKKMNKKKKKNRGDFSSWSEEEEEEQGRRSCETNGSAPSVLKEGCKCECFQSPCCLSIDLESTLGRPPVGGDLAIHCTYFTLL